MSAQTLADSLLLSVSRAAVMHELAQDPQFAMRMLAGLSRRLHGLVSVERRGHFAYYSLKHEAAREIVGTLYRHYCVGGVGSSGGGECTS